MIGISLNLLNQSDLITTAGFDYFGSDIALYPLIFFPVIAASIADWSRSRRGEMASNAAHFGFTRRSV